MRYCLPLPLVMAALVGCGGGPAMVRVAGTVSVDDTPLDTGNIAFHPVGTQGESEAVVGRSPIEAGGKYNLYTDGKQGLPAGSYKVVVLAGKPSNPKDPYSMPISIVDKKYTQLDTTPLTVEVSASASPDRYNFSLTK